jgi:hypothetical protein
MKRSPITKKASQRKIDFDKELDAMRPIIAARSKGNCEADRIVFDYVIASQEDPALLLEAQQSYREVRCWKRASEVHHRKYRRRGGTNSEDNLAHLCLAHHAWAHRHGGFGRYGNLVGLALSSGQSEEMP